MFIAAHAARSTKLRRSGMYSGSFAHCQKAEIPIHAAPTELAWASAVVVTINMALLTELDRPPPSKMRVRCSVLGRSNVRLLSDSYQSNTCWFPWLAAPEDG